MNIRNATCAAFVLGAAILGATTLHAQAPAAAPAAAPAVAAVAIPAAAPPAAQSTLYAVEFKTGPGWDAAKPPGEQTHFREHSANLKRLRDQGSLVLGARYSDKGFIVLQAATADEAHAMIKQDPSVQARVFAYELHPFNVFYGGTVAPKPRN